MSITKAPKTITVYSLTGQADYQIPFEYLARKFVVLTLLGVDRKVLTINTDYRFVGNTTISLTIPQPAGYSSLEIRRVTSATDRIVSFNDGSILRSYDLNIAQIQALHVAEEARDLTADTIGVNDDGDLDCRGRKIINLAAGSNDLDAVNFTQLKQYDTSTLNNANTATNAALEATTSKDRSLQAEARCVSSAGTALQASLDANKSEVDAKLEAQKAKLSETNAKTSETNAAASEAKALQYANIAQTAAYPDATTTDKGMVILSDDAQGDSKTKVVTEDVLKTALGNIKPPEGVPTGLGGYWIGAESTVPSGYLVCKGQPYDTTANPKLFVILGTSTLPDTRGVILRGLDNGRGLDSGRSLLSYQADEIKSHNHSADGRGSTYGGGAAPSYWSDKERYCPGADIDGTTYTFTNTNVINNTGGTETRMKNIAIYFIVKAG